MMKEAIPKTERTSEHIPSHREVRALFDILTNEKEFRNIQKKENEKGLYIWSIRLKEPNEEGESVVYTYMRTGRYPEGQANSTAIYSVFLDSNGIPTSGASVAKYDGTEWVYW